MPASASPRITLLTTALTFSSSDLGATVTPADSKTCAAYLPQGTSGAQMTTIRFSFARSATPVTPCGLPGPTMIASRLVAKISGSFALLPASVSLVMLLLSAEANTSAGAPCPIWATNSDDAAKLNVTFAPGYSAVNASPTSVNAAVSEAAANTVTSPTPVAVSPESSEPHAAATKLRIANDATRSRGNFRIARTIVTG